MSDHRGIRALSLRFAAALLTTSTISFFVALKFVIPSFDKNSKIEQAESKFASAAADLIFCLSQFDTGENCSAAAADITDLVPALEAKIFRLQVSDFFAVKLFDNYTFLLRADCRPQDLEPDKIAWSAWPVNKRDLPPALAEYGHFGGYESTKKAVKLRDGGCLLAFKLPSVKLAKLLVGQINTADGKFKWKVETNIPG